MSFFNLNCRRLAVAFLSFSILSACGGAVENTTEGTTPEENPVQSLAVFFGTDYNDPSATGVLEYTFTDLSDATLYRASTSALGSDAALVADEDGFVYAIHSGYSNYSENNVTKFDPANAFGVLGQYSTGDTNPIAGWVEDGIAYVSLTEGDPDNLLIMDMANGSELATLSFLAYAENDGNQTAYPGRMLSADNTLYVLMQDLDYYSPTAPGKLVSVDMATRTPTGATTLLGRQPFDIAHSEADHCFFIAHLTEYSMTVYNYDTSTAYGGLEVYCPTSGVDILIPDEQFGGYTDTVAVNEAEDSVFIVVSSANMDYSNTSKVLRINLGELALGDTTPETSTFFDPGTDILAMAQDPEGRLWVSSRTLDPGYNATDPRITVLDPNSGATLATYIPTLPVASIAFTTPQ